MREGVESGLSVIEFIPWEFITFCKSPLQMIWWLIFAIQTIAHMKCGCAKLKNQDDLSKCQYYSANYEKDIWIKDELGNRTLGQGENRSVLGMAALGQCFQIHRRFYNLLQIAFGHSCVSRVNSWMYCNVYEPPDDVWVLAEYIFWCQLIFAKIPQYSFVCLLLFSVIVIFSSHQGPFPSFLIFFYIFNFFTFFPCLLFPNLSPIISWWKVGVGEWSLPPPRYASGCHSL